VSAELGARLDPGWGQRLGKGRPHKDGDPPLLCECIGQESGGHDPPLRCSAVVGFQALQLGGEYEHDKQARVG
jgi:hypothetical protein